MPPLPPTAMERRSSDDPDTPGATPTTDGAQDVDKYDDKVNKPRRKLGVACFIAAAIGFISAVALAFVILGSETQPDGTDISSTPYCRYIQATHGDSATATLARQTDVVRDLLKAPEHTIKVQHKSVLDGNHRAAVCIVTGKTLHREQVQPYQTLEFPSGVVEGRRLGERTIDYDFTGKKVIDLGCNDGMMSIYALRQGAAAVVAVDAELCSTTWQIRKAWHAEDLMLIDVANIDTWTGPPDADVVMAFSVIEYLNVDHFASLIRGRDCILETHMAGQEPPKTGHRWTKIGESPYRRAEPDLQRDIFLGQPPT